MPIKNRLNKNYKHLKKWAKRNQLEAFRLYERDIPEFPFIIDILANYVVVYFLPSKIDENKGSHTRIENVFLALEEVLSIKRENIIFKVRSVQKGLDQYTKLETQSLKIIVKEKQASFNLNLTDYVDTGLFLDHRPIRQQIYASVAGHDFLNLFSYTGAVSVFAALAGAKTTSVDMSATYQRWTQDNFSLNNIKLCEHEFYTQNVLTFLEEYNQKMFDTIFLDPPTFSNSKKMLDTFDVLRDHEKLISNTMKLLKKGGVLYFSNNKRGFKLESTIYDKYQVADISFQTIPEDFKNKKIHVCFNISHKTEGQKC